MTSIPSLKRLKHALCLNLALFTCSSVLVLAQTSEDTVEARLNAYDQVRIEQLIDEGQQAMNLGEFSEAERLFLDAVQIAKINHGLNSARQRIPLERAIAAQLAQGKWEQVDNHLDYFEWLNKETYQRDFFAYLRGTEQLNHMLLKASADSDNPLGFRYLIAAKNLNWRAVAGIEATLGESHPELAPWLYNIVLAHYYQSSLIKRHGMVSTVILNEENEEVRGWTLNKGESLRISYRIGKELLQRIAGIYEESESPNPEAVALTQIYIADWEMMFGNEDDALNSYKLAYDSLLAAGISKEETDRLFAQPAVLPSHQLHTSVSTMSAANSVHNENPVRFNAWSTNYPATAVPSEQVAVNSDATSQFMALLRFDFHPLLTSETFTNNRTIQLGFNLDDLEVISTSPDSDLVRERALYEVSLLQFRPQLRNGLPTRSENFELQYFFPPKYNTLSLSDNSP